MHKEIVRRRTEREVIIWLLEIYMYNDGHETLYGSIVQPNQVYVGMQNFSNLKYVSVSYDGINVAGSTGFSAHMSSNKIQIGEVGVCVSTMAGEYK